MNMKAVLGAVSLIAISVAAQAEDITVVLSEEPDIIDACEASRSNIGRVVKQNIAETLTEIDPDNGSITPRLATAWEQVDDLTWRFTIREGVTFHDGEPLNAETVAYAINRTLDPNLDCEIRIKFFGGMTVTPEPVDEYTLDIKTAEPAPILPTMMGTMTITSPNTPMGERTRNPVGTGPYKLAAWDAGQSITLESTGNYWGGEPPVTKATYVFRGESAVRAAMVETGEADLAPNIAVQDATNPDMDFSYFNSETSRVRIDTTMAPLNDVRVRKAANLAIDREAIRGSILSAEVVPATQLVVPAVSGHNPNLEVWPYDPAQAKTLLAEAAADGVPVDTEVRLLGRIGIYPNSTEATEAIGAMLTDVGFNIKIEMMEVAQWVDIFTKPYAEDRPPTLQMAQHDNNNGDAVFTVYNKYHSGGGQSTTENAELDALIEKATVSTGEERQQTWQEVFRMLHEDLVSDIDMYHMVGYTRIGPRIHLVPNISMNSELQLANITFK
ncbi:MAG: ABC transporter substrate-binding protein [Geminicoccaceae bacterium]